MPSTSNPPSGAVVYIEDSFGQGSGVLIAPDEVLTASHVVYESGAGFASNIAVSPGYDGSTALFGTVTGVLTHAEPIDDAGNEITSRQSQTDFAVVHLAEPVTGAAIMAVGSNAPGGTYNLSGYPQSAGGRPVRHVEALSRDPRFALFEGRSIAGYPGSLGSSGGPIWTDENGVETVVGLTSSVNLNGAQSTFVRLTSADQQQIASWVSQDDGLPGATGPGASLTREVNQVVTGIDRSAGAPFSTSLVGSSRAMHIAGAVLAASNESTTGSTLDEVIRSAEARLAQHSGHPDRSIAYLAGLALGLDGQDAAGVVPAVRSAVSSVVPGSNPTHGDAMFGTAGFLDGERFSSAYGFGVAAATVASGSEPATTQPALNETASAHPVARAAVAEHQIGAIGAHSSHWV